VQVKKAKNTIKAKLEYERGMWCLVFCDPKYDVYSYEAGDALHSVCYSNVLDLPKHIREAIEQGKTEIQISFKEVLEMGLSVVDKELKPVVVSVEDLEKGMEEGFYDSEGLPLDPDSPNSPLMELGLI